MKAHTRAGTESAGLSRPGIVLGLGLGGFVDGIVLHQIAQWHNMLSSTERCPVSTVEGMERNMLADGLPRRDLDSRGPWALATAASEVAHTA